MSRSSCTCTSSPQLVGGPRAGDRLFKGSPLARAKRSGLLRSAALALGNRPDPASADALIAALGDDNRIVRCAAAWAIGRWRESVPPLAARVHLSLTARLPLEADAAVRAEIDEGLREDRH